jgi:hypothetical protein
LHGLANTIHVITQGPNPCENNTQNKKANESVYEHGSFTQPIEIKENMKHYGEL